MSEPDGPKILIVAPNASARMGGEAFLPLKYFEILTRRGYPARLIAHSRNRDELSDLFGAHLSNIHYIEDSKWHRAVWRLRRYIPEVLHKLVIGTLMNLVNEAHQKKLIRRLVDDGKIDLIHQPIPVSPRAPSRIFGFGVPVIIGPMNGNMSYPEGYEDYETASARHMISLGRALAVLVNLVVPGKRRADVLLVANERTLAGLPFQPKKPAITLVENGVDLSVWSQDGSSPPASEPGRLRLIFMGRMIKLKGLDFTIKAIGLARHQGADITLDILGDGPERPALERQVTSLDMSEHVRFHGFLSQSECANHLRASDALILNSLRECGGAVVLEAMSLGRPVIAADWGGPADYIDPTCGVVVPPVPKADFAERLAASIVDLANDPEKRLGMAAAGIEKIKAEFDWEKKIDRMLEIYRDTLAGRI